MASSHERDLGAGSSKPLSNHFILPTNRTGLQIRPPPCQENNQNRTPSPEHGRSASPASPASPPTIIQPSPFGLLPPAQENPGHPRILSQAHQQRPQRVTNELQRSTLSSSPVKSTSDSSTLDVYALSYIPQWLVAANESVAVPRFCSPLERINYADYVSSFAGRQILQPLECANLPKIQDGEVVVAHQASPDTLSPDRYGPYFWQALQHEVTAEAAELSNCSLFLVTLTCQDRLGHHFGLKVPGLRENSPRVEVGDVILVRPLFPHPPATEIVSLWYAPGGGRQLGHCAPGFSGLELNAIVCGLDRSKEEIVLRMDGVTHLTCNLIFRVQQHRVVPISRAIISTADSLQASLPGPKSSGWLRRMLFPVLSDGVVQSKLPEGRFRGINWLDTELNYEQQKTVNAVSNSLYGCVPYLISGPPGSGKTKTIVETTLQLLQPSQHIGSGNGDSQQTPHIIICAPSDPAADTLASRLARYLTPTELFRLNGWSRSFPEVPDVLLPYSYVKEDLFSLPAFETLMSYKVVVSTCRDCSMLVDARVTNEALSHLTTSTLRAVAPTAFEALSASHLLHWTALLIDEAAQATEPESLIPLMVIAPPLEAQLPVQGLPKVVMAGDEHQLGPRVFSKQSSALSTSLFARLFARDFYAQHPMSRRNGSKRLTASMLPMIRPAFANLVRNYRSHPSILSVPSQLFYNDTLIPERTGLSDVVRTWPGWKRPNRWPVLFVQNSGPDTVDSLLSGNGTGAGALSNPAEASVALKLVKELLVPSLKNYEGGEQLTQHEIAVVSPFEAQVRLLRRVFRENGLYSVNIGPLVAFQGLESRIVVLCTTRTRRGAREDSAARFVREDRAKGLGVIGEPKRFNVAITRAKEGLIVIGNPDTLTVEHDPCWAAFLSFCARNGCVLPESRGETSDVDWVERFAKQDGVKEGRLERALVFAANMKMRDAERKMPNGFGYADTQEARPKNRFSLKGQMATADDEMWKTGLRMAEEMDGSALMEDEDEDEGGPADEAETPDAWNPDRDPANMNGDLLEFDSRTPSPVNANALGNPFTTTSTAPKDNPELRVFSTESAREFDRDPKEEFERTDCATQ